MDKATVNAIGRAITVLGFDEERAARENDKISYAYAKQAKDGLIALLAKEKPQVNVTPEKSLQLLSACRLPE